MTADAADSLPPERVTELLAELDEEAQRRRQAAAEEAAASARCRAIVVELLRARAVPRKDLIGRPFSDAGLTIIANEEGLTRRGRQE